MTYRDESNIVAKIAIGHREFIISPVDQGINGPAPVCYIRREGTLIKSRAAGQQIKHDTAVNANVICEITIREHRSTSTAGVASIEYRTTSSTGSSIDND